MRAHAQLGEHRAGALSHIVKTVTLFNRIKQLTNQTTTDQVRTRVQSFLHSRPLASIGCNAQKRVFSPNEAFRSTDMRVLTRRDKIIDSSTRIDRVVFSELGAEQRGSAPERSRRRRAKDDLWRRDGGQNGMQCEFLEFSRNLFDKSGSGTNSNKPNQITKQPTIDLR